VPTIQSPTAPLGYQKARFKGPARRTHCVSVRLNEVELARVKTWTGGFYRPRKLGQVLRDVALGRAAIVVPEVNRDRWQELARALSNLNQLAFHLNSGRLPEDVRPILRELLKKVRDLRTDLLGKETSDDC